MATFRQNVTKFLNNFKKNPKEEENVLTYLCRVEEARRCGPLNKYVHIHLSSVYFYLKPHVKWAVLFGWGNPVIRDRALLLLWSELSGQACYSLLNSQSMETTLTRNNVCTLYCMRTLYCIRTHCLEFSSVPNYPAFFPTMSRLHLEQSL